MDDTSKVKQIFNSQHEGVRTRGRQRFRWWECGRRRRSGIAPVILNLALNGREWLTSGRPLYMREIPQYSLNRRLGGPQSQCGSFGEKRNLLPLPEFKL
jgi:hypothetical protein